MSNIEAAIGCGQMERIDELISTKRRIFKSYKAALAELPLSMNPEPQGRTNGCWMPTVVVDEDVQFDRERLIAAFGAAEIDARVFFWPLSMLPMFESRPENTVSYGLYPRAMNLPSYHELSEDDITRVAEVLRGMIGVSHLTLNLA